MHLKIIHIIRHDHLNARISVTMALNGAWHILKFGVDINQPFIHIYLF